FQQVKVPILGIVENMSYLDCPHCEERIDVFSNGGGKRTADAMNLNFLGALPLDPQVRVGGDTGRPVAAAGPDDTRGGIFYKLAEEVMARTREASKITGPTMTVSD